ncbi:class I SAM-dependent methyltransferase [Solirubrobacter soli]|uniref:class I SAM-dependent methyltransferase n=1 Tax=Solirubrobacter soli TaxID=363832 RepID=UPI000416E640|nr:class I SAM-dependent methyltransferase [Solirubrobacter soli]
MSFVVAGDSYDKFMGRYSRLLAPQLADYAGVASGQRVIDVGSGPGALTEVLVERLGAAAVVAADPSPPFVAALRERLPGVEAVDAPAETLPFADDAFDVALAQLVVHFMKDPVGGVREMARVTRPGGIVAASVWDLAGDRSPLAPLWRAVRALDSSVRDESGLPGAREGQLVGYFEQAGLTRIEATEHEVPFKPATFEEWWDPFELGVGPAGQYVASLDDERRVAVRERSRETLATAKPAVAWVARGVVA